MVVFLHLAKSNWTLYPWNTEEEEEEEEGEEDGAEKEKKKKKSSPMPSPYQILIYDLFLIIRSPT